jgi:hypothetical protein
MAVRARLKFLLPLNRLIDLPGWNFTFLCDPVRENDGGILMKKVEYSIIHMAQPNAKLVNTVPQEVGLGSSKFMPKFSEPFNPHRAFIEDLRGNRIKPIEHWDGAVIIFVKQDSGSRHLCLSSQN